MRKARLNLAHYGSLPRVVLVNWKQFPCIAQSAVPHIDNTDNHLLQRSDLTICNIHRMMNMDPSLDLYRPVFGLKSGMTWLPKKKNVVHIHMARAV